MKFQKGDFLKLQNGIILEVLYADEEKMCCMKLHKHCETENCVMLSNKDKDYPKKILGVEKISNYIKEGCYNWKPLKPKITFPMV